MQKILIIQDSPSLNAMLTFRLEAEGFEVATAVTGEEGLEKAASGYDIVILDYNLPGMNGEEVCKRMRSSETLKRAHILMMSASDEGRVKEIVERAGADGYVLEPFSVEDFKKKIKDLSER